MVSEQPVIVEDWRPYQIAWAGDFRDLTTCEKIGHDWSRAEAHFHHPAMISYCRRPGCKAERDWHIERMLGRRIG